MASQKSGDAYGASSISGRSVIDALRPVIQSQENRMSHRYTRLTGLLARLAVPLSLCLGLSFTPISQAQEKEDIVIGGSIPMSGVFAFAGVGIHAGIGDYVKMINEQGGIAGRKLRYVPEDTGYKVDVSVAAFKKITSQ